MPRKGDNVRARLQQAALELYGQRGFDRVTTAQIAEHVGVTERTFFRHFADKREVLFDGEAVLRELLYTAVTQMPDGLSPLAMLQEAFRATESLIEGNRSFSEPSHAVIAATPALQERELMKIASLTNALASLLQKRGVDERSATLAAQVGMAAFTQAATRWLEDPALRFGEHLDRAFSDLRALSSVP